MAAKSRVLHKMQYYLYERKGLILENVVGRFCYLWAHISIYAFYRYLIGDYYKAMIYLFRYERDVSALAGTDKLSPLFLKVHSTFLQKCVGGDQGNRALNSYVRSEESEKIRRLFRSFGLEHLVRMKYPKRVKDPGRQGDLMILKPYIDENEKGVVFVQYDEGVKRFASIFDIEELVKYYRIVVEPSTSGYQNAMFFLCYGLDADVFIEAQFEPDFQYIGRLGNNFIPVRLGAGDWTDPETFAPDENVAKKYDVVMIANWLKWKRHDLLFSAISKSKSQITRVAVIGYSIDGRTLEDVQLESEKYGVRELVDFYEKIPLNKVSEIIKESKVGVLLSPEEGANRAIYECFFSNVPVVLSDCNRGVNRDHLNSQTGMLAPDMELHEVLGYMVENYEAFRPREWADSNTGYWNSSRRLNDLIKKRALENGEKWTKDIFLKHNSPHARYKKVEEQTAADRATTHLHQFLRN